MVTNSDFPSGLNAACPGVPVNAVAAVVPRPRLRDEPGIGETGRRRPGTRQRPAAKRVEHVRGVPVHGHADREVTA